MGANISTFKHPKAPANLTDRNDQAPQSSIIELLKPECLKVKKKNKGKQRLLHPQGKKPAEAETLTLEERLLTSPSLDQDISANADVAEVCVLKNSSSKIHPSCLGPVDGTALSLARPANRDTGIEDECPPEVCNARRGENGRSRKRVRFRLPEESDIIILISSPKERLECDEESGA